MARIRTIKPEFFTDEDISDLPPLVRLYFIGLWCQCDKAGRIEDKPRQLGARILPYHTTGESTKALEALVDGGFVVRYSVDGRSYLQVRTWFKHQKPHHTERDSDIPPCSNGEITVRERTEGKGREGKGREGTTLPPSPSFDPLTVKLPPQLETSAFRETWSEWVQHRTELRPPAPLTPTSVKQQLNEFAAWGERRSIVAIRHTIKKGWRGIREPDGPDGRPAPRKSQHDELSDRPVPPVT